MPLRPAVRAAIDLFVLVDSAELAGFEQVVSGSASPRLFSTQPACSLA
jgi:hypothetical protein